MHTGGDDEKRPLPPPRAKWPIPSSPPPLPPPLLLGVRTPTRAGGGLCDVMPNAPPLKPSCCGLQSSSKQQQQQQQQQQHACVCDYIAICSARLITATDIGHRHQRLRKAVPGRQLSCSLYLSAVTVTLSLSHRADCTSSTAKPIRRSRLSRARLCSCCCIASRVGGSFSATKRSRPETGEAQRLRASPSTSACVATASRCAFCTFGSPASNFALTCARRSRWLKIDC